MSGVKILHTTQLAGIQHRGLDAEAQDLEHCDVDKKRRESKPARNREIKRRALALLFFVGVAVALFRYVNLKDLASALDNMTTSLFKKTDFKRTPSGLHIDSAVEAVMSSARSPTINRTKVLWTYPSGARNSAVRITIDEYLFLESTHGISAVDRSSGIPVWAYRGDAPSVVWVKDDTIVFLDGTALKAVDIREGRLLWAQRINAANPEAWGGGSDYIAVAQDFEGKRIAILDPLNGKSIATFQGARGTIDITIVDDVAVVHSSDGWSAYSIPDGSQLWTVNATEPMRRRFCIDGDRVYLGIDTRVSAVEIRDGNTIWVYTVPKPIESITTAGDYVAVTTLHTQLHIVVAGTGTPLWNGMQNVAAVGEHFLFSTFSEPRPAAPETVIVARSVESEQPRWRWSSVSTAMRYFEPEIFLSDSYVAVTHAPSSGLVLAEVSILEAETGRVLGEVSFFELINVVEFLNGVIYVLTESGTLCAYAIEAEMLVSSGYDLTGSESERSQQVRATLTIQGIPAEARIFVNGHLLGLGPELSITLPFGHHEIEVELGGYDTVKKSVVLDSTDPVTMEIVLTSAIRQRWRTTDAIEEEYSEGESLLITDGRTVAYATGKALSLYDAEYGTLLWCTNESRTAGPALAEGVVSWASKTKVKAASPTSGVMWERSFEHPITWLSTGHDLVLVLSLDGTLSAITTESGSVAWEVERTSGATLPVLSDDTLCLLRNDGRVSAIDLPTGRILWKTRARRSSSILAVAGSSVYAFDSSQGSLAEYDLSSGVVGRLQMRIAELITSGTLYLLYSRRLLLQGKECVLLNAIPLDGDSPPPPPLLHQLGSSDLDLFYVPSHILYVASKGRLKAYDLLSDGDTWTVGLEPSSGYFLDECENVVFISYNRSIIAVDRESGARVWESKFDSNVDAMTTHKGSIFFATDNELFRISLD